MSIGNRALFHKEIRLILSLIAIDFPWQTNFKTDRSSLWNWVRDLLTSYFTTLGCLLVWSKPPPLALFSRLFSELIPPWILITSYLNLSLPKNLHISPKIWIRPMFHIQITPPKVSVRLHCTRNLFHFVWREVTVIFLEKTKQQSGMDTQHQWNYCNAVFSSLRWRHRWTASYSINMWMCTRSYMYATWWTFADVYDVTGKKSIAKWTVSHVYKQMMSRLVGRRVDRACHKKSRF